MKVGIIGLGKLGTPVALAMNLKGHDVMGYDIDPARMQKETFSAQEKGPNGEPSIEPLLRASTLKFGTMAEVVRHADIIFVAVQTPHSEKYEGVTRLPDERVDFDYTFLKSALVNLNAQIEAYRQDKIVVVISTVLPGTVRREILPYLSHYVKFCYNPFFIAMGTTIQDFLNPEFVLFGYDGLGVDAPQTAMEFYETIHQKPFYETSIENAELIKVIYNTFISMKICLANTVMEICHKTPGCDVDEVTTALALGTDRLLSPKYLKGGMGDGGGCHPRDNIALSFLARKLNLSFDWFENLMLCREKQTGFLVDLIIRHTGMGRVRVLGKAFKAGTNLTVGSPSTLLVNMLEERSYKVYVYDPHVDADIPDQHLFWVPATYFIATNHPEFATYTFPAGSTVIDPWRYIPDQEGVNVIRVGVGSPQ